MKNSGWFDEERRQNSFKVDLNLFAVSAQTVNKILSCGGLKHGGFSPTVAPRLLCESAPAC